MEITQKYFFKLLLLSFLWMMSSISSAANANTANMHYEPVNNLKMLAQNFIEKNVLLSGDEKLEVQVNQTDAMLSLAACTQPLEATFPGDANISQITAVEVRCQGAQTWRTMVPVTVTILAKVLVAKRTIPANTAISEDDLDYALFDRNRLYNGYFQDKTTTAGQVTNQVILSGVVLNAKNVQKPIVVYKNQIIDLVARSNAITVTMKGIAKADGRLNETIKAFNPSSKRTLDAVVIDSNRAEVVS